MHRIFNVKNVVVVTVATFFAVMTSADDLLAQDGEAKSNVEAMAGQIQELMDQLSQRNEEFPPFIKELEDGLVTIEQAQEKVDILINDLREATDKLQDGSDFDKAIDAYKEETVALIAQAEASNNEAIKGAIPELTVILQSLEDDDKKRSATVVEARNLLRTLERNDEALVFFIKAKQVKLAAKAISENVADFEAIVENGKVIAQSLLDGASL